MLKKSPLILEDMKVLKIFTLDHAAMKTTLILEDILALKLMKGFSQVYNKLCCNGIIDV